MPGKKENNKASYEKKKYFLNTQNIKREPISGHDKYIREKTWLSDLGNCI